MKEIRNRAANPVTVDKSHNEGRMRGPTDPVARRERRAKGKERDLAPLDAGPLGCPRRPTSPFRPFSPTGAPHTPPAVPPSVALHKHRAPRGAEGVPSRAGPRRSSRPCGAQVSWTNPATTEAEAKEASAAKRRKKPARTADERPLPWVPSSAADGGVSFNLAAACNYALRKTQHPVPRDL